jgi:hypothetical protein
MAREDKINRLVGQTIARAEPLVDQVKEKVEPLVRRPKTRLSRSSRGQRQLWHGQHVLNGGAVAA